MKTAPFPFEEYYLGSKYFDSYSGRFKIHLTHKKTGKRINLQTARYNMCLKLGRILTSNEVVHHINEDKTDDRIENLEILSASKHAKKHDLGSSYDSRKHKDGKFEICLGCGNKFWITIYRLAAIDRAKKKNPNTMQGYFCSQICNSWFREGKKMKELCIK